MLLATHADAPGRAIDGSLASAGGTGAVAQSVARWLGLDDERLRVSFSFNLLGKWAHTAATR